MKTKAEKGTVTAYAGKILSAKDLFELDVDILVPGARPNVINADNVSRIKAKYVVEAANLPIPHDIERVLEKRGVTVIPDFVANAGGVISSWCETVNYPPEEMFKVVKQKIESNTKIMLERAQDNDSRKAAMEIARERVETAMRERGWLQ
jgi:glutamate dehydrogenase/leucine dehydrogenase